MPEVDVVDATWIAVRPAVLAALIAEPSSWSRWWPDLQLRIDQLRGVKGVRWSVLSGRRRTVSGSMEIWLEPVDDGTVVHYFIRLDGTRRPLRPRERARVERHYRTITKQVLWGLSDRLDPGRLARVAGPPTKVP